MTSRKIRQFLTPIVTGFITQALVLSLQNHWPPLPPKTMTSYMNDSIVTIIYTCFNLNWTLCFNLNWATCFNCVYGSNIWYNVFDFCRKRYDRVEKEFIEAKIDLQVIFLNHLIQIFKSEANICETAIITYVWHTVNLGYYLVNLCNKMVIWDQKKGCSV